MKQTYLNNLYNWCNPNGITLNIKNCQIQCCIKDMVNYTYVKCANLYFKILLQYLSRNNFAL